MHGIRVVLALLVALVALGPAAASADDLGLHQVGSVGDLTAELWLAPGVFRPTAVELHLSDAAGRPPTDVGRVDLAFAMRGMNHGARGIAAELVEPGVYQAAGYLLAMSGSWWLALRVERSDGRLDSALFAFEAPYERTGPANILYSRPLGDVQVEDVAVTPDEVIPSTIGVTAGLPVRLEVMYVDAPACGPSVSSVDPPVTVAVSPDGLAELTVTPTQSARWSISCTSAGLVVGP